MLHIRPGKVPAAEFDLARRAWNAFCSPDPSGIAAEFRIALRHSGAGPPLKSGPRFGYHPTGMKQAKTDRRFKQAGVSL